MFRLLGIALVLLTLLFCFLTVTAIMPGVALIIMGMILILLAFMAPTSDYFWWR